MEDFQKPVGNEVELIEMFVPDDARVAQRKMFGYPAAFVNGRMFLGTYAGQLILKLDAEDEEKFKKELGGRPFSPMPGHTMKGFVMVPEELIDEEPTVREWVAKSLDYIANLPPKLK